MEEGEDGEAVGRCEDGRKFVVCRWRLLWAKSSFLLYTISQAKWIKQSQKKNESWMKEIVENM